MNKTSLVLRNEIRTQLRSRGFLFATFGLPLIAITILLGISLLKRDAPAVPTAASTSEETAKLQTEGYVDYSGLIQVLPPDLPEGVLIPYSDEASAHSALRAGEIAAYYVLPSDYVRGGELLYVNPDYRPASSDGQEWIMRHTIFANLLGNDPERIARASLPMEVEVKPLAPDKQRDANNPLAFYVPYAIMLLLYAMILISSSLLLHSISTEKKDQVVEVLLLSTSPGQILTGKIVGLGLLGLLQAAVWMGTGYAFFHLSGRTLSLPGGFELPPSIMAWGILFFLLGYAVYASLMASLGALVPNIKEASQMVILVIWPLLLPLFLFVALIEKSHEALAVSLSLFPLTAPVAMMTRLAVGGVPLWQPLLAAGALVITAALVVRVAAGVFRAQTLLSGQPLSAKRFYAALLAGK